MARSGKPKKLYVRRAATGGGFLAEGVVPLEERCESVEHGLLLDSVAVICQEARGRREDPRHRRARRRDRTVTERSLDEGPRRIGVKPFVRNEVLELIVPPGLDVATPLSLDVRVDGHPVDECEDQVALIAQGDARIDGPPDFPQRLDFAV